MNYDGYFLHALAQLRDERRYRVFADLERIAGRYPHAVWHSPAGPRSVVIQEARNRMVVQMAVVYRMMKG